MKKNENYSENFPAKAFEEVQRWSYQKRDRIQELSTKEVEMYCRLFPFTDNKELRNKFDLSKEDFFALNGMLAKLGIVLKKDDAFINAPVRDTKTDSVVLGGTKTPGYIISSLMNSVSEEERREIAVMVEEGVEPIKILKDLITLQTARVIRGFKSEQVGTGQPYKTVNEAASDLHSMLKSLHEMEEGKKTIIGVDDSFKALVQQSQIREEDDF